ncbi:MAG TPA: hypothetical protein VGH43_15920 [Jatrophihabitans sp.]|jgi:hypothetical protein
MTKRRNMIIASVGAAVAAGIVTVSAVAGAASAPTNHTIRLIATQTASHNFSRSSGVEADTDRHNGKVIGYDVLSFIGTGGGKLLGSFATRGGVINFRIPLTKTKTLHGKVTGGSGRFSGVSGTIAATPLNKANTRTAVKIVWHH